MPVIQTYDQRTETPVGGVDGEQSLATPVADAVAREGQEQAQSVLSLKQQLNVTNAKRGDVQLTSGYNDILQNPTTGFFTTMRGEDALRNHDDVLARMKAHRDTIAATLKDPAEQRVFNQQADIQDAAYREQINAYTGAQHRSYQDAVSDSRVDANSRVVMSSGDPTWAKPNLTDPNAPPTPSQIAWEGIKGEVNAKAARAGLGPEYAAQELAQTRSKLLTGIVDAAIPSDAAHAAKLLADYGELIDPVSGAALKQKVALQRDNQVFPGIADAATTPGGGSVPTPNINPPKTGGLTEQATRAALATVAPGFTITSAGRTPGHNAAVGGVPTSRHLISAQAPNGLAYDVVPPSGMTTAQLTAKLKATGQPFAELLDEGDHVHVSWGAPKHGAPVTVAPTTADVDEYGMVPLDVARQRARDAALADDPNMNGNDLHKLDQQTRAVWGMKRSTIMEAHRSNFQSAIAVINAGGTYADLPVDVQAGLLPTQARSLQKISAQGGFPKHDDPVSLAALYAQRSNAPQDFMGSDLSKYATKLTNGSYREMLNAQLELRQNNGQPKPQQERVQNIMAVSKPLLDAAGIDPDAIGIKGNPVKIKQTNAQIGAFQGWMFQAADAWAKGHNGKEPDQGDLQVMAKQGMMMTHVWRGGVGGPESDVHLFETHTGDRYNVTPPPAAAKDITDRWARAHPNSPPLTPNQVGEAYKRGLAHGVY